MHAMQAEETERRTVIADSNANDPSQDLVKLRRMSLSIHSVPRSLDLHAAVGTAAQRAVSVVGEQALGDVRQHHPAFDCESQYCLYCVLQQASRC